MATRIIVNGDKASSNKLLRNKHLDAIFQTQTFSDLFRPIQTTTQGKLTKRTEKPKCVVVLF